MSLVWQIAFGLILFVVPGSLIAGAVLPTAPLVDRVVATLVASIAVAVVFVLIANADMGVIGSLAGVGR